jgi:hypothetical protein
MALVTVWVAARIYSFYILTLIMVPYDGEHAKRQHNS